MRRNHFRLFAAGLLVLFVGIFGSTLVMSAPDHQAQVRPTSDPLTITKTGDSDDGVCDADCSLREAITAAVSGDNIEIPAATYTLTVGSRFGVGIQLAVDKTLTLTGAGSEDTIIQASEQAPPPPGPRVHIVTKLNVSERIPVTLAGDIDLSLTSPGPDGDTIRAVPTNLGGGGVFLITGGHVNISGVTVRHAYYSGGIVNLGGILTISDSIVTDNASHTGNTGTVSPGGGIWNLGILMLNNSSIKGNYADAGGGIANSGTAIVTNSTISDNRGVGGGIHNSGVLNLVNSTVSHNRSRLAGGGIYNRESVTLTNSTISNNEAWWEGTGFYNNGGTANITASTIKDNTGRVDFASVHNDGSTVTLTNTIIANRTGDSCSGSVTSLGHNLDTDGTCGLSATGDLSNTDPLLGPLQDNGGPTFTHALLPDSPAIDAGDDASRPDTDQRGVARPQGAACDIGAYEYEPPPPGEQQLFVYSAKIVCVPELGKTSTALVPGAKYRTAVNVHNPWQEPAHIKKWVTLARPQGKRPIMGQPIEERLEPTWAFDVDCVHMKNDFGLPDGASVAGGKGFLVIQSDRPLDVVAVYMTKKNKGSGISIDVEYIQPKVSPVGPHDPAPYGAFQP